MTLSQRPFQGVFIVLEGIDGAGTTTHAKRLAKTLSKQGRDVRLTCEPTTGPVGGLIRQVLQKRLFVPGSAGPRAFAWSTMALLFAADRLDHLDSFVVPALREGAVVVSDRYDISSLAYQSVTAPEEESAVEWIRKLNARALRPNLTLVLDIPAERAAERRRARGSTEELFEDPVIQRRLVEVYDHAEALVPDDHVVHLSSDRDVDEVATSILEAVIPLLDEKRPRPD
ncbi:MAG: dTMP kinase [Polyangiaceae bacterium]